MGKSALADDLADRLDGAHGPGTSVVVVDSMQVYEGLAEITNQARRRPAELVGVVPVTERWTVARHKEAAEALISPQDRPVVLDAGTGMYLNAILLDVPLAPEVPEDVRHRAAHATAGETNPRRAARELELRMVGAGPRGSIWDAPPRHDVTLVYLRPDRHAVDAAISRRSALISRRGQEEAEVLNDMLSRRVPVNPSVLEAVGVEEMLGYARGETRIQEATERIEVRTRRLARRQMRWFDKLARALSGKAGILVTDDPSDARLWHIMHGRMGS